jgi:hypothetical protein
METILKISGESRDISVFPSLEYFMNQNPESQLQRVGTALTILSQGDFLTLVGRVKSQPESIITNVRGQEFGEAEVGILANYKRLTPHDSQYLIRIKIFLDINYSQG